MGGIIVRMKRQKKLWGRPPVKNGINPAEHRGLVGLVIRMMPASFKRDREEAESAAYLGLVYASRYWNPLRGCKFSTYAVACIKGFVLKGRDVERRFRVRRGSHKKGGVGTSRTHLFSELGGTRYATGNANIFAVDIPMDHGEIEFPGLHEAVESLQPRYKTVVELRFGLGGFGTHTLEQVGKVLFVTKERVRQIEARAVREIQRKISACTQ